MDFGSILRDLPVHGILAIEAATGTGKTTGIYRELQHHTQPTIFIMHTRVSIQSLLSREGETPEHVLMCTPFVAMDHIINHPIHTVIVDEAHVLSREYDTVFSLLQIKRRTHRFRVIMLSATLDTDRITRIFPDVRILRLPQPCPFPIQEHYVSYENLPHHRIPSMYALIDHTTSLIHRLDLREDRVLVFLPGHEYCNRLQRFIQSHHNTVCLHGGMSDDDINKTREIMSDPSIPVICCTTNMSETAITFPGISVVIDSGLRSVVSNGNQLEQEWCDRGSMIQRAGRTGRTRPGTVYRLMSREHFESMPLHKPPDHNYDPIVLYLLTKKIHPVEVLGDKATPTMDKIQHMGITPDMYRYLFRCGMEIEQGVFMYRFMDHNAGCSDELVALMVLCMAIISMYQTRPMSWVYIPPDNTAKQRHAVWDSIRNRFCVRDDLLATIVQIVSWIFSQKDPKKSATKSSLNFRSLRETRVLYERVMKTCLPSVRHPCSLLHPGLWKDWGWKIRRFLYTNQPDSDIRFILCAMNDALTENDRDFNGRGLVHPCRYLWMLEERPPPDSHRIVCLVNTSGNFQETVLWTLAPNDYRDNQQTLCDSIMQRVLVFREKENWKKVFEDVVREIREEVAFRPNMCGMEDAMSDFLSLL